MNERLHQHLGLSRYEWPTFPRGMYDATVVNQRALLPNRSGIAELPDYPSVGEQFGNVIYLARGAQMVASQPGELEAMDLWGSWNRLHGPLRHIAYRHGSQIELKDNALVEMDTLCPGGYFDLDCGCGNQKDHHVKGLYEVDASAAAYISLDAYTLPSEAHTTMQSILDGMGIRSIGYGQPDIALICATRQELLKPSSVQEIYYGLSGKAYLKTHDVAVTFRGGNPARLMVIEEPVVEEINGYNQRPKRHYVFVYGDIQHSVPVVRYHSACITAELGGNGCDCHHQLQTTLSYIKENGSGVIIYADEEGMDLGLAPKFAQTMYTGHEITDLLSAREFELGLPGDLRNYELIGAIRQATGLTQVRVVSNNLSKFAAFGRNGVHILGTYPIEANINLLAPQAVPDIAAKKQSGRYIDY